MFLGSYHLLKFTCTRLRAYKYDSRLSEWGFGKVMTIKRRYTDFCVEKEILDKKMWSTYTMEYYSAIRNNKYPSFASTWIELEGIMLSEVEKDNHMV